MEENTIQVPLLHKSSTEATEEGGLEKEVPRPLSYYADTAALLLSNRSGKWKFKHHRLLSGRIFLDAHDHSKGQREYNRKQREALARFHEVDSMCPESSRTTSTSDGQEEPNESLAITLSYLMNAFLFIIKAEGNFSSSFHLSAKRRVVAAVRSGSLSIVASALDSLLDLLAGAILWFTKWSMQHHNKYKYPIGKTRMQPVGIVIFAAIMATLGMQVLLTALQQLIEGVTDHKLRGWERTWLVTVMGIVILSKLCMYLYCRNFKSDIVQAYATDHRLDILTNSVGLAAALLADRFVWWIDPTGALFLALYTICNWSKTVIENAASLVGQSAPPEFLQLVTYIAYNHHHKIRRLDTVRAYMLGGLYFVEVDIELPEDMMLREAHNIGETLQNKLEALPEVERAYVHLDFECDHRPEHNGGDYNVSV